MYQHILVFVLLIFLQQELSAQPIFRFSAGESYPGTININAPMGTRYQDVKHAVLLQIITDIRQDRVSFSSSFFVNTVNQNGKYYMMTAAHTLKDLIIGEKINLQLMLDFEAVTPSARTPQSNFIPIAVTVTVVDILPKQDLLLLEVDKVPKRLLDYPTYFAGWSADALDETPRVLIGHPANDLKKIYTVGGDLPLSHSYYTATHNLLSRHYRAWITKLNPVDSQLGTSGGPLLNAAGQVVGVLSSGVEDAGEDLFSSFNKGSRPKPSFFDDYQVPFQDYLDPDTTYVTTIPGGFGLGKKGYVIPSASFNLTLRARDTLTTPSSEDNVDFRVDLKLLKAALGNNTDLFSVLRRVGSKSLPMQFTMTEGIDDETLYSAGLDEHAVLRVTTPLSEATLITLAGYLGVDYHNLPPRSLPLEVSISIENLSDEEQTIRAIKIPGLGFRNALQLFKPDALKALYRNANYPACRGLTTSTYLNSLRVAVSSPEGIPVGLFVFDTENNGGYVSLIQHEFPTLRPGSTVKLTFTPSNTHASNYYRAWIDYNKNYKFDEPDEIVVNNQSAAATYVAEFTIPEDLVVPPEGIDTRIRVALQPGSAPPANSEGEYAIGEVEDYTVRIMPKRDDATFPLLAASRKRKAAVDESFLVRQQGGSEQCASTSGTQGGASQPSPSGTPAATPLQWKTYKDAQGTTNYALCSKVNFSKHPLDTAQYTAQFTGSSQYITVASDEPVNTISYGDYDTVLSYDLKQVDSLAYIRCYKLPPESSHPTVDNYAFQENGEGVSLPYQLLAVASIPTNTSGGVLDEVVVSVKPKDLLGEKIGAGIGTTVGLGLMVGVLYYFRGPIRSFLAGYRRLQQNEGSVSYNNTTSSLKVNVCKKSD